MHASKLIAPDLKDVLEREPERLAETLADLHAEDLADLLQALDPPDRIKIIEALPQDVAADVLGRLPEEPAQQILNSIGPRESAALLTEMNADDRADVMQDLPEQQAREILASLEVSEPGIAEQVRVLSSYGEQTAGGIMTTDYLALWPELTVSEAIEEVRRNSHERNLETVYYLYVVAYDKLIGVLSLRDLLLNDGSRVISSVMTSNVVNVGPETDQEEVAAAIARYDLSAIPVVDQQGRMLGVVTVDDVVDVVIEEATEDAHKMAAMVPVGEGGYFDTSFREYFKSRIIWLVVLFVCGLLTTLVMNHYQGELAAVMDLVIFVPLIISSGGNSGSQSSSLIIRALALGELKPADWQKVFGREALMGLCLGLVLGMVGFARAVVTGGISNPTALGCTVALSVVAVVTLGTLVGSLMPLIIEQLGLDPAVSSTPFVASVVDVIGLVVYFSVAHALFTLML